MGLHQVQAIPDQVWMPNTDWHTTLRHTWPTWKIPARMNSSSKLSISSPFSIRHRTSSRLCTTLFQAGMASVKGYHTLHERVDQLNSFPSTPSRLPPKRVLPVTQSIGYSNTPMLTRSTVHSVQPKASNSLSDHYKAVAATHVPSAMLDPVG